MKNHYLLLNPRFANISFAFGEEKDINYKTGDAQHCPECGGPISMLEWMPPYDISVSKKTLGDLIFGPYVGFACSKKFKDEFERVNLTGLSNFPRANLNYKKEKLDAEYYYPKIALIKAFIDLDQIEFDGEGTCNECQVGDRIINKINGINFLYPSEIKEDIFFTMSLGQAFIFVSEDFKRFLCDGHFDNINVLAATKFIWDSLNPGNI